MTNQWVFGYGSLIFRPGFDFLQREVARLPGYQRRFWQGSHDHRGVPEAPGRVVTLIAQAGASCMGMAYLVDSTTAKRTFDTLDHREKNGYTRLESPLTFNDGRVVAGVVYIATPDNFAFLGDASLTDMAQQIADSCGPSGRNSDYLFDLASALRDINADDDHVFALEAQVKQLLG